MIEYQLVLNVYVGGRNIKQMVRSSDRDASINRHRYIKELLDKGNKGSSELRAWVEENLNQPGTVTSIDGLYGVVAVKIL